MSETQFAGCRFADEGEHGSDRSVLFAWARPTARTFTGMRNRGNASHRAPTSFSSSRYCRAHQVSDGKESVSPRSPFHSRARKSSSARVLRYTMRNRFSTTFATRGPVQRSVGKPEALAPARNTRASSSNCNALSLGLRPARPARCSPGKPSFANALAQRLTDWRLTPSAAPLRLGSVPSSTDSPLGAGAVPAK